MLSDAWASVVICQRPDSPAQAFVDYQLDMNGAVSMQGSSEKWCTSFNEKGLQPHSDTSHWETRMLSYRSSDRHVERQVRFNDS